MKKKRFRNISVFNARVTSAISVGLVLLMLGIVALVGIGASNLSRQIKETLGFSLVLREDITEDDASALLSGLQECDFAREVSVFSSDDAMKAWEEEIGENVVELIGVNPFATEINVRVKAEFADDNTIARIADNYRHDPRVEEITLQTGTIADVNRSLRAVTGVLTAVALALLAISLVLINNTVRLTIFARRFSIHTMKLVGATDAFIRAPFVRSTMFSGGVAGLVAAAVMAGLLYWVSSYEPSVGKIITWGSILVVSAVMVVCGMIICALAATVSTNRYLRMSYSDMFE